MEFLKHNIWKCILDQFMKGRSHLNVIFVMQVLLNNNLWKGHIKTVHEGKKPFKGNYSFPKSEFEWTYWISSWKKEAIQM